MGLSISILSRLKKLNGRSKIVAKNAIISLFLKGFSILLSFIFVPLYLGSVGLRQYGIILTITSVSNFISFFDVGIGNGLRSKLGKAIAEDNRILGRKYVSTSYYYVGIAFLTVFLLYCLASPWINWYSILNIPSSEILHLHLWMFMVVGFFVLRFIFQLIGNVLMADQKSFIYDFVQFSTSLITIIICIILKSINQLNFYSLLLLMCVLPVMVLLIYSIIFYTTKYKWLKPSLVFVDHSVRGDLLSLGFKFFLIQIVALTIFSTSNILIAQLFNIGEVTTYNIAFKYYNITVMLFAIFISPLWGAFTNAWYHGDVRWIIKNFKIYITLIALFLFVNLIQYLIYPFFMHVWLKREMTIQSSLVIAFILYNFIFCYNDIFAHFLASIGEVNRQVYAAVLGGLVNIPITIFLAKHTQLGLSSILFANVICLLPSTIVTTIQALQLFKSKLKENNQLSFDSPMLCDTK